MKLPQVVNNVTVSNTGSVNEFRIRSSAKSFSILSNSLYQNKIRAIIRELSCNAFDSQVSANVDYKFEIHLPTEFEPYFSIRDYGTGLTEDQVLNLYTTYFESTKTDSNDFIGALGLGSKSPFSYTSAFTITAIKDKQCGIYSAFINAEGIPSIARMAQFETELLNGVEIQFAVNSQDFKSFAKECQWVFQWWKPEDRPIFKGMSIDIVDIAFNSNFDGVFSDIRLLKQLTSFHPTYELRANTSYVVMGKIAYQIDETAIDKKYHPILQSGFIMEFPIGELDFQPSREGLSYIEQTKTAITNKLQKLYDYTLDNLKTLISTCSSRWERNSVLIDGARSKYIQPAVEWYINNHKDHDVEKRIYGFSVKPIEVLETKLKECNIVLTPVKRVSYHYLMITPSVDIDYGFVINESGAIGAKSRSMNYWKEGRELKFIITRLDESKPIDLVKFKQMLNDPPDHRFYTLDDLPKHTRNKTKIENKTNEINIKVFKTVSRTWFSEQNVPITLKNIGEQFYLKYSSNQWDSVHSQKIDVIKLLTHANTVFDIKGPVFCINKRQLPLVQEKTNWINLETYITDKITQYEKDLYELCLAVIKTNSYEKIHNIVDKYIKPSQLIKNDVFKTRWSNLFKDTISTRKNIAVVQLIELYAPLPMLKQYIDYKNEIEKTYIDFLKVYPMIKYFDRYVVHDEYQKDLLDYINLVNSQQSVL